MFKINLFFTPKNIDEEYEITWPWKWRSRSLKINDTWKLLNGLILIHYEYVSLIDSLSAILHDHDLTYLCPFAATAGHWRGRGYMCIN